MVNLQRREPFARIADDAMPPSALADVIVDQSVRSMYLRLVDVLRRLHGDVCVEESAVELRAGFRQRTLCRVVPYRELLHIQVGSDPTWEVRVRDRAGYLAVTDRILREFCHLAAESAKRGSPPNEDPPAPAGWKK